MKTFMSLSTAACLRGNDGAAAIHLQEAAGVGMLMGQAHASLIGFKATLRGISQDLSSAKVRTTSSSSL